MQLTTEMIAVFVIASLACIAPPLTAAQQSGCGIPSSETQVAGLIAGNYASAQGALLPSIVLQASLQWSNLSYRIVCLSTSGIRDRYRFVSIVAYYTINGQGPEYGQYEFECVQSQWSSHSTLLDVSLFNRVILTVSSPAINATLRTDCSYCLRPTQSLSFRVSDAINHCNRECFCILCVHDIISTWVYDFMLQLAMVGVPSHGSATRWIPISRQLSNAVTFI